MSGCVMLFFFKQKTAYDMRISDWSSDVCSSDLVEHVLYAVDPLLQRRRDGGGHGLGVGAGIAGAHHDAGRRDLGILRHRKLAVGDQADDDQHRREDRRKNRPLDEEMGQAHELSLVPRSEEHTSEPQAPMSITYR